MGIRGEPGPVIHLIEHIRGQPYPKVNFDCLEGKDLGVKAPKVAASTEELQTLIDARRLLTGAEKVIVAYYAWE